MAISRVLGGLGLLAATALVAQGCSSAGLGNGEAGITEEDAGSVVLALMNSPADATCLRLTAQGATTAIRSFDLAPGQATTLKASGLPLGSVAFTAEGFAAACSTITDMSVATWNSDKVSATLAAGVPATISIALHRPGSANISVSFPEVGTCNGTPGQWNGCRGTGCWVCSEQLAGFPKYMQNHPGCVVNDTCAGQFFTCNAACPAPTDADRDVAACDGTPGQWSGCRGTGCSVCSEKLSAYPLYFQNHPSCLKNDTCGGQFFTCNAACPAPTAADQAPATRVYLEAESGGVAAPLSSFDDAAASGGKYVMVATGNNASTTAPSNGHLTYSFSLASAGTVKVFGRFVVGAGGGTDDSVWARVDGGTWLNWNNISARIGTSKPWAWDSAHDSSAGDVEKTWALSAGNHTLEVAYREDGLEMDRFFVTSDVTALP
jgi:hypothetical protein